MIELSNEKKVSEGWGFLVNSRKAHYFRDGRSLCRRWMCFSLSDLEQDDKKSPDDCKACRRKRDRELLKTVNMFSPILPEKTEEI